MKVVIIILGIVLGIGLLIALAFAAETGGLKWKRHFAPKHEDVRREVFKATRSFNEAKLQELVKYRHEYMISKDEMGKKAIMATVRMGFADFDKAKLPYELQTFLEECNY